MSDAFQHINRLGDVYLLQAKTGKSGERKYSFARKLTGEPVPRLPEGYEARESPESGQIVIRKSRPSPIRPDEKTLLEQIIREETDDLLVLVDVEDRSLVVYTAKVNVDVTLAILRQIAPVDAAAAEGLKRDMIARAHYSKMMRFTLADPEQRLFNLDRWCFLGTIENWYALAGPETLGKLAREFVPHLDKESFYELM